MDHQVKVRGNRIELGEIEAALSKHPAVRDNVVETSTDEDGSRFVVGYVVLDDEVSSDLNELRSYLKEQLPDYMVPSVFMPLSRLPLTTNGRIARRELPAPSRDALVRVRAYAAPRDEVEAEVARIWSEVLGIEKAGVNDDFFELGGHSLLATSHAIGSGGAQGAGFGVDDRQLGHRVGPAGRQRGQRAAGQVRWAPRRCPCSRRRSARVCPASVPIWGMWLGGNSPRGRPTRS